MTNEDEAFLSGYALGFVTGCILTGLVILMARA